MTIRTRRRLSARVVGAAVFTGVLAVSAVSPAAAVSPATAGPQAAAAPPPAPAALPTPTGRYPVGLATMHLRDDSRPDPWVPDERRELMVSLWYPAAAPNGRPARYLTDQESALIVRELGQPGMAEDALARVRTHARAGAPPLRRAVPLVVLSPGFSLPRGCTERARRSPCQPGLRGGRHRPQLRGDRDHLPGRPDDPVRRLHLRVLTARGHRTTGRPTCPSSSTTYWPRGVDRAWTPAGSRWSATRSAAPPRSPRCARTPASTPVSTWTARSTSVPPGCDRPFMLLGTHEHQPGGRDVSWDTAWSELAGWKRWLTVTGAGHSTFTDLPLLGDQLGLPLPEGQTLGGARGMRITSAYVTAFLDEHLRGVPRPLLRCPRHVSRRCGSGRSDTVADQGAAGRSSATHSTCCVIGKQS